MSKISIILPVYNGETYLRDSIESILNQTYSNFELIIVDDGSIDNSSEIAQNYVNLDSRVIYVRNAQNLKLPAALNLGFAKATGTYWTWTSCDNLYYKHAFAVMVAELEHDNEFGLVYADIETIDETGKVVEYVSAGMPDDLIMKNVVGACFLYKKEVALKAGLYDLNCFLCEDYEYWLRIGLCAKLKKINKLLYKHRYHKDSLSYKHKKSVITIGINIQKQYKNFYVNTCYKQAQFYACLRSRDIYNPWRQFYLIYVLFYSRIYFFKEIKFLLSAKIKRYSLNNYIKFLLDRLIKIF